MKSLRYCLPIILFNSQLLCWISLACLAAWYNPAGATIRYVNGTAASGGNGSTWVLSYQNLQDAIDASTSGDEIWVAAGTYVPTKDPFGNTTPTFIRDKTFYLKDGVKIFGGFAGIEIQRSQRNWVTNVTTLSGDLGSGNKCYHVVLSVSDGNTTELDGFSITNGSANGSGSITVEALSISRVAGGGMYNVTSTTKISNCIFSGNIGSNGSGLANRSNAAITLTNCVVRGNNSTAHGGGIYNAVGSSGFFINCTIYGNTAGNIGGAGMYNESGNAPTLKNCIVYGNTYLGNPSAIIDDNSLSNVSYSIIEIGYGTGTNRNTDPQFVSSSNLHLQSTSPAINAGTLSGALTTDLDGNPRPSGCVVDMGAYEYQQAEPEINLQGGNPLADISDGSTSTSGINTTDFGSVTVNSPLVKTYTIQNTKNADLTITSISKTGTHASDFTVADITFPAVVTAGNTTTFTITFTPGSGGTRTATIQVNNNDCNEAAYDFAVTGRGALVYTFNGTTNTDWATASNWSTNSVPTTASLLSGDAVVIAANCTMNDVTISFPSGTSLTVNSGKVLTPSLNTFITIASGATLTVNASASLSQARITNNGIMDIYGTYSSFYITNNSGGVMNVKSGGLYSCQACAQTFSAGSTINNDGTLYFGGGGNAGTINNNAGGTITDGAGGAQLANSGTINNAGTFTSRSSSTTGPFNNTGTLTMPISCNFTVNSGGTLNNSGTVNIPTGNIITVNTSGTFTNTGTVNNNATLSVSGTFTNNGTYKGSGTYSGSLFTNPSGGTVVPGNSPGCATFSNGYTNSGTLSIELGGTTACTQYDRLNVTGTATLGGTLDVSLINGYVGNNGNQLTIINATALSGTFATVDLPDNWYINYNLPLEGQLTLSYNAPILVGAALNFDGTDDYVGIAHNANLAFNTAFTVETWVYPKTTSESFPTIFSKNDNQLVMWLHTGSGYSLSARVGGTQLDGAGLSLNTWAHVAITYDGTKARLYLNGILQDTKTVTAPNTGTTEFRIGQWTSQGRLFKGNMDDFRIWNYARNCAQIAQQSNCELAVNESGLVAYYKFNQGVAEGNNSAITSLTDATANGYNGTFQNMPRTGTTSNFIASGGVITGTSCLTVIAPEINLKGNENDINYGSITATTSNHTDFGDILVNGSFSRTFTIDNTAGTAALTITGITSNNTKFAVNNIPASVATGGTATFTVTFNPTASGTQNAVITINNNDCNEAMYDFMVTGSSVCPATASISNSSVPVCVGSDAVFTLTGTSGVVVTYNLNGTGNTTVTLTGGTATITVTAAATNQTLNLVSVNNGLCTVDLNANATVTVKAIPLLNLPAASLCVNGTMNLSPNTGGTWSSNDTDKATITNAGVVTGLSSGNVTFTFTETVSGCRNTTSSVAVNPLPTATVSGGGVFCSADVSIALTGSAPWNLTYSNGISSTDVTDITSTPYVITGAAVGIYTVTALNDDNCTGTSLTGSAEVTTNPAPSLTYSPASVSEGSGTTINPATGPSDNGSVSAITVQDKGTYIGTVSVHNTTGIITLNNAAPFGTHTLKILITDNCNGSREATVEVTVTCPTITVSGPANLPSGTAGTAYGSAQFTQTGSSGSVVWSVSSNNLPAGLTLDPSSGQLSGTPSVAAGVNIIVRATNADNCYGENTYTLQISCPTITLNPASGSPTALTAGTVKEAYSQIFAAAPAGENYTYSIPVAAIPPGLQFNTSTGELSGTPTTTGTFGFTVTASGFGTCTGQQSYSMTINCQTIAISPTSLPGGATEVNYNQQLSAPNASGTANFTLFDGTLPANVTMSLEGLLSGAPTAAATYTFTVKVTDANLCTATKEYSVTIVASNTEPTITAIAATRQEGSAKSNSGIAIVDDKESGPGGVTVTVTSTNPSNGVTISNIVNTNGNISADIIAACGATNASFTLTATDGSLSATTTLNVTVDANTIPSLAFSPASVSEHSNTTVTPSVGPSDNGNISNIVVQDKGTYIGTVTVNSTSGIVTISNATPVGVHAIAFRVTDNCGATTDAVLNLTVICVPPTLSAGVVINPANCSSNDGSITFKTTNLVDGMYTLTYSGPGSPKTVSVSSNTFVLSGLSAGTYSNFTIVSGACSGNEPASKTLAFTLPTASISGTTIVCKETPSPVLTFTGSGGVAPYKFTYSLNGGSNQTISTGTGAGNSATLPIPTTTEGIFTYTLISVNDATDCGQNQSGSAAVTVTGKPTVTLSVNGQTFNKENNPTLCDTDANSVNPLQFTVLGSCVVGSPVWRVQISNGAWSSWSSQVPVSQSSDNQLYQYQAACDDNCSSTFTTPISLTINYRASAPQNVSLVADGTTVLAGESKAICNTEGNTITFNASCASGEILLYSVDGSEYSSMVPSQNVDGNFHNYRVRCRKADGTPSCAETESEVMSLKIITIPITPTVSISPLNGCGTPADLSGTSTCGALTTVWYNAATNQALPGLPTTTPTGTTSYYARCKNAEGCLSDISNTVTFTITPVNEAPVISASAEIVCTGTEVRLTANCPAGASVLWNNELTSGPFKAAFANVTRQSYTARCVFANGCQSPASAPKTIIWKAFEVTFINVGQSKSDIKPANERNLWSAQFITPDAGPALENSTQENPTIYHSENLNKTAPRFWTIHVDACALGTNGSLTFDMLATPETGIVRSYNTHENNAPYLMYANRDGFTELYAQNHPAYGFFADNGNGGNVYNEGLPKGLYKLGVRYWDQKGQGSIYPSTRQPQGNVLAYQEYWFRIQSKDGVGKGAAKIAAENGERKTENGFSVQVMPNPVANTLHLNVNEAKGQKVNVSLLDATGRILLKRNFVPETNQHQDEFEVSQLANGMYFLNVSTENRSATLKVLKAK